MQLHAALHVVLEDRDDALKADGEATGRHILAAELADHLVVAAAAGDGKVVAVDGHLEDRAGAVAHAIDKADWDEIIGTIAGDDTIMVVVKPKEMAEVVVDRFMELQHSKRR